MVQTADRWLSSAVHQVFPAAPGATRLAVIIGEILPDLTAAQIGRRSYPRYWLLLRVPVAFRYFPLGAWRRSSGTRGASSSSQQPLVEIASEQIRRMSGTRSLFLRSLREGAATSFSRPGPLNRRRPSRSEDPYCGVRRDRSQEVHQFVDGTQWNQRRSNYGQRYCLIRVDE